MRAGLLVPHVDDLHALGDAAVVDRQDVAAAEREHVAHARLPERARDQVSAVEIRHASRPARGEVDHLELQPIGSSKKTA